MKAKKLTIEERRNELEKQIEMLDTLAIVEDTVNDLIQRVEEKIKWEKTEYRAVGKESTQMSLNNMLYWTIEGKYSHYSDSELETMLSNNTITQEQFDSKVPYYRDTYEDYIKTDEELSDYENRRISAYTMVINYLKEMDY